MNRTEALELLDLTGNEGEGTIYEAFLQKKNFFTTLKDSAPNEVLQKIHTTNLNRVEEAFNLLAPDHNVQSSVPKESLPQEEKWGTSMTDSCLAWLVVHTEGLVPKTFKLGSGKNSIGRSSKTEMTVSITDDVYVSRMHACIEINAHGEAILTDGNSLHEPSKNGTYVNGAATRLTASEKYELEENDTIQIGTTKLVFKWNKKPIQEIQEEISHTMYIPTVVINI